MGDGCGVGLAGGGVVGVVVGGVAGVSEAGASVGEGGTNAVRVAATRVLTKSTVGVGGCVGLPQALRSRIKINMGSMLASLFILDFDLHRFGHGLFIAIITLF